MRCGRCGAKMSEDHKDTLFRGPVTIFKCRECGEMLKRFEGPSKLSSFFISRNGPTEKVVRRADPVSFDPR